MPKYVLVKKKGFIPPVEKRVCKTCLESFPLNRDYFGNTPNGNYRWQCRSCMRNHVKNYSTKNPDAAKTRSIVRKEREAGGREISVDDVNYLMNRYSRRCAYCDVALGSDFHVDHVLPVAKGGSNELNNLAVCCPKCNLAKHAKTVQEFYAWMELRKIKYRLPKLV